MSWTSRPAIPVEETKPRASWLGSSHFTVGWNLEFAPSKPRGYEFASRAKGRRHPPSGVFKTADQRPKARRSNVLAAQQCVHLDPLGGEGLLQHRHAFLGRRLSAHED